MGRERRPVSPLGETVVGIVRSVEEYGTFVEIAPNLAGLAESCSGLAPGQAVSVYIKNILPEKMKIKLVIVNHALSQPHRFELRYFITEGHLDRWVYSTPECPKRIETDFCRCGLQSGLKAFILIERVFVCPLPALLAAAQTFDTM